MQFEPRRHGAHDVPVRWCPRNEDTCFIDPLMKCAAYFFDRKCDHEPNRPTCVYPLSIPSTQRSTAIAEHEAS